MADLDELLSDLQAESRELDALVAELTPSQWQHATPAEGWTIAHQIGHLAWTDTVAVAAVSDRAAFDAVVTTAIAAPDRFADDAAAEAAAVEPATLLQTWRLGRDRLQGALRAVPVGDKVPWFGPPMSATSMATARLMETWAHGQDVADALDHVREPSARMRHVAHIGVRTRDFAFVLNDATPPSEPFRVELVAPSGELWTWGPDDAAQRVTGPALDFCLLATQRRHRDDLAVVASGSDADTWLDIVQAFAGPPGPGRSRAS